MTQHEVVPTSTAALTDLQRRLLNDYQQAFPITSAPFAQIARELGVSEQAVLEGFAGLREAGMLSRIGPVFAPQGIGASTLAAMAVPAARLDAVAACVNAYAEVNHNYEREHEFNLWFVVTAQTQARVDAVLRELQALVQLPLLNLPLQRPYHIGLGFSLWN